MAATTASRASTPPQPPTPPPATGRERERERERDGKAGNFHKKCQRFAARCWEFLGLAQNPTKLLFPRIFLRNPQNSYKFQAFPGLFAQNSLNILQIAGIFCNIENAILTKSRELLQNPRKNLHDVVDMLRIPRAFSSKIHKNPTNSRDFLQHPKCNLDTMTRITVKS